VLFQVTVTKTWLRQVIVGLTLICRGSYRGVVEFLRDLLGVQISIGTVHHVLQPATRRAGVVNHDQDLSGIRVGLHDEIFHGAMPVLAGVDAASTYCHLLAAAKHRDADTWGVRAAPLAEHVDRILAGVEPASSEARRQVPCGLRRRQQCHGRNTA
jgi:hypothetical protein